MESFNPVYLIGKSAPIAVKHKSKYKIPELYAIAYFNKELNVYILTGLQINTYTNFRCQ